MFAPTIALAAWGLLIGIVPILILAVSVTARP
jgi:hypothetical protein